jgi:hypothetical protein
MASAMGRENEQESESGSTEVGRPATSPKDITK